MILSDIIKQKCTYGVFLLFQYPFFAMLAITVAVARQPVTYLACGTSFFALELSSDNKELSIVCIITSKL